MNPFEAIASKNYEFRAPQIIHYGLGCLKNVGSEATKYGRRALLVSDQSMQKAGYVNQVLEYLKTAGIDVAVYDQANTEPTDKIVEGGLKVYREANCEMVIGLGGGSPIDAAKAIAVMATNTDKMPAYMGLNKVPNRTAPIIAIPTTAGTGSEATRVTVITDTANDVKMLIMSDYLMPQAAFVDPLLTLSMPAWVASSTAIDALTHSIEAYVSRRAQPITDMLALEAISLIGRFLRRAWANPEDLEAKSQTMLASTMAGMAFSNASVAMVHGMSRPIGACFHVPHGLSNAILLPLVMEFSCIAAPERFARIAEAMGEDVSGRNRMDAARAAVQAVRSLCDDIKIPRVSELKIKPEEFLRLAPKMAEDALASGSPANNPRRPTKEEIIALYGRLVQ